MNVYRILFGSLARYVRAENHAHARAIAENSWRKVSHRISGIDAIGNYAPQSLGARGYDSAVATMQEPLMPRERRKAYASDSRVGGFYSLAAQRETDARNRDAQNAAACAAILGG